MKKNLFYLLTILVFLVMNTPAIGQHYTDWTGFEIKVGRTDSEGRIVYYELQKDYTISLPEYFLNADKLPDKKAIDDSYHDVNFYHSWASNNLLPMDWDFIRLEMGGILTIKKGYRWDGASRPCKKYDPDNSLFCVDEHHNFRSSFVHDAIYDLMRMGYLHADERPMICAGDLVTADLCQTDEIGDRNRQLADMLHYMIAVEDGDSVDGAHSDYYWLRVWGACRTHMDSMLTGWKYHVSELTAYASDGLIELTWKVADDAGADPDYGDHFNPYLLLIIQRNGVEYMHVPPTTTSFVDPHIDNGTDYSYQIVPFEGNENQDDWSNLDFVRPLAGPGMALVLDGVDDYIEANIVANDFLRNIHPEPFDITLEAWVYPETQADKGAIIAFNTFTGGNYNMLFYDGALQKFCYYDPSASYVFSAVESVAGQWHHVAVTLSEHHTEGTLYVNGMEQETFTTTVRPAKGALFSIGQEWDNAVTSQHFKGKIDEVRIWKDNRSQAEIQAAMCCPLRGDEAGLVALWHFDDPNDLIFPPNLGYADQVRKAFDATANANDGTLLGYDVHFLDEPFMPSTAMNPACNLDSDVDGADLATFAPDFGRTDCNSDCAGNYDGDDDVDVADLATLAADFGMTDCPCP